MTQSQDQFVIAMVIQAIATVVVAAALAVAMTVALGPLAAAVAALAVTASSIGGNYARWRAGRRRAAWYARDHP